MSLAAGTAVVGAGGLRGRIESQDVNGAEGWLTVRLDDGRRLELPASLLTPRADGTLALPLGPTDLPAGGPATARDGESTAIVVPIVAEEAEVRKRLVETGRVRLHKAVHAAEQVVDVPFFREEIDVERVPVGREVDAAPPVREEGDTTIIPVLEEVLVVQKRLRLREEIRVTRRRVEHREPQRVTLRSEEVHVERTAARDSDGPKNP